MRRGETERDRIRGKKRGGEREFALQRCHATHSETDARFPELPSLSFCAGFSKERPSEAADSQLRKQRPGCVVCHRFRLKD